LESNIFIVKKDNFIDLKDIEQHPWLPNFLRLFYFCNV